VDLNLTDAYARYGALLPEGTRLSYDGMQLFFPRPTPTPRDLRMVRAFVNAAWPQLTTFREKRFVLDLPRSNRRG
jgi:hypothetical protein